MTIFGMSKDDFELVPTKDWAYWMTFNGITSLVIIPTDNIHESGFALMRFVAADKDGVPMGAFGGWQDVIHLNGLLGIGDKRIDELEGMKVDAVAWSIDCLPCGYLRLFAKKPSVGSRAENLSVEGLICSDLDVLCR